MFSKFFKITFSQLWLQNFAYCDFSEMKNYYQLWLYTELFLVLLMQRRDLRQPTNGQPSETRAFTWSCEKWGYITKHFKWCSISNRDHFGITLLSVILNFFWGGTQSAQFWAKFWTKLPIFSKIFLILSQFWFKFGQILKNRPIHIPDFAFYKGSFIYQEADFATHVSGTSP